MDKVKGATFFFLLLCTQSQFFNYFLGLKLAVLAPVVVLCFLILVYCEYEYMLFFIKEYFFILLFLLPSLFINANQAIAALLKLSVFYSLITSNSKFVSITVRLFVTVLCLSCVLTFFWSILHLPVRKIEILDGEHNELFNLTRYIEMSPFGASEPSELAFNRIFGLFGEPSEAVFFLFPFLYHYFYKKQYYLVGLIFAAMCFTGSASLVFLFLLMLLTIITSKQIKVVKRIYIALIALMLLIGFIALFWNQLMNRLFSFGSSEIQISRVVTLTAFFENKGNVGVADFAAPNSLILFAFNLPILLLPLFIDLRNRFRNLPDGYSRLVFFLLLLFQSLVSTAYYESLPFYFLASRKTDPENDSNNMTKITT